MTTIPGGLKIGMALFFQGVVPLGSKGYALIILITIHGVTIEINHNRKHLSVLIHSVTAIKRNFIFI